MPWDLDAEIAKQRSDVLNLFNDSCDITRMVEVSDGQGGIEESWVSQATDVVCRLVTNQGTSSQVGAQMLRSGDYTLTVPYDTDIAEDDKITLASSGFVFRVLFVDDVRVWRTAKRVQVSDEIED